MNPIFQKIKETNCDAISFLPCMDEKGKELQTAVQGLTYNEKGDNINSNSMGDYYDIITFGEVDGEFVNKEQFQAILVCPYTYGEKMFKEGYFGFIGRKTTTSDEVLGIFEKAINKLFEVEDEQV